MSRRARIDDKAHTIRIPLACVLVSWAFAALGCSYGFLDPPGSRLSREEECDLFEKACSGSDGQTCASLAACIESGWRDRAPDQARARAIYEERCAHGAVIFCKAGIRLLDVNLRDFRGGTVLAEHACEASMHECEALGNRYLHPPSGIAPDVDKARAAFRRGCLPHHVGNACYALDALNASGEKVP